ncbi:hypothetical protein [Devosia sp. RR2S18]|uniref:hypothetical protein n=1 Tax=Devosia rhizosphaerae TaxID=3049774 RepID=UPI002540B0BB|nr:hypothetical protein [Devosia sp. RR2S18]WIJ24223.1 hypothetical protein QOV41_14540 [Devosia sp. RR2S18]
MPIDDDSQSKLNSHSGAVISFLADLDSISPDIGDASSGEQPSEGSKLPRQDELLRRARDASEHIKEHDTRYNQNKRDWEAVDAKRKGEGRDEYNAQRRGEYAGHIMETERRTVRAYRVPDGPEKQERRRKQQSAFKQAKLQDMTPEELVAFKAKEAKRKRDARAAKKN